MEISYTDNDFMSRFELGNVCGIGRRNEEKLWQIVIDTWLAIIISVFRYFIAKNCKKGL